MKSRTDDNTDGRKAETVKQKRTFLSTEGKHILKKPEKVQKEKRPRRKLRPWEYVILAVPTVAAIIAVALTFRVAERGIRYEFTGTGHQYYAGATVAVAEGQILTLDSNGVVRAGEGQQGDPVRVPIYLDDQPCVVLPSNMAYYDPRGGDYGCVPSLSEVCCDEDGNVFVTREGKTVQPRRGFLFDGSNFYLFLEKTVISFNGYEIEVPALSYVEAVFGGDVMVFHYLSKEFTMERSDGAVTAKVPSGDYSISLLDDSMVNSGGQRVLLVSRPDLLDPIV